MMETRRANILDNRQLRLFGLIFVVVLGLLAAAYYFFLRTEYVVLFNELRPAEAAAAVTELDRQGVAYALRDDGATILVPSDRASAVRVALAGSDFSLRGMVGFELFNESDMGLTDFAQRVNYQRALQGELSRTIMSMDGIESARVHLAIPERSLFRGARSQPRAAVTVIPRRGSGFDERRVTGIQRLVAAAVPDLSVADVVVLDGMGRTISSAAIPVSLLSPETEEHGAIEQYYHARTRAAVQNVLPSLRFDVRVMVAPRSGVDGAGVLPADAGMVDQAASGQGSARNFRLRIILLTATELSPADQSLVRSAVSGAVGLDESNGDALVLSVGPVGADNPTAMPEDRSTRLPATTSAPAGRAQPGFWSWWLLIGMVAIMLVLLLLRPRRLALPDVERERFVQRIRDQLNLESEGQDARA